MYVFGKIICKKIMFVCGFGFICFCLIKLYIWWVIKFIIIIDLSFVKSNYYYVYEFLLVRYKYIGYILGRC